MVTVFVKEKGGQTLCEKLFCSCSVLQLTTMPQKALKAGKPSFVCVLCGDLWRRYKKVTLEKGIQKYHPPFAIAGILLTILNIPSNNYILYFAQQFRMTKQYPIIKARIQVLEKASVVRYLDILKTLSTIEKYNTSWKEPLKNDLKQA